MKAERKAEGFTLIELLVVIAIIGVLAAVVLASLNIARQKGRDASRASQAKEIIKALELYYSDNEMYPVQNDTTNYTMTQGAGSPMNTLINTPYFSRIPNNISDFRYCEAGNRYLISINTELDKGGTDYCHFSSSGGGVNGYGCDAWASSNAADSCESRF